MLFTLDITSIEPKNIYRFSKSPYRVSGEFEYEDTTCFIVRQDHPNIAFESQAERVGNNIDCPLPIPSDTILPGTYSVFLYNKGYMGGPYNIDLFGMQILYN